MIGVLAPAIAAAIVTPAAIAAAIVTPASIAAAIVTPAAIAAAVATPAAVAAPAPPAAAASLDPGPLQRCAAPPGWDAVAKRGTRFVIFGETYGTAEAPALVGDVACTLAFDGERVLVGVALDAADDAALQAAWKLPDDRFAAALARIGWAGRRDGVASRAMVALLIRLHRLSAGGRVVDVVAFNGARDADQARRFAALPGQGSFEAARADNVRLAGAGRYDHVLVLVGAVHARKAPVTSAGVTFQPMAMRLAPPATTTSLVERRSDGTMGDCPSLSADSAAAGKAPSVAAATCAAGTGFDPAYDGWFRLGRITVPPPPQPRAPAERP